MRVFPAIGIVMVLLTGGCGKKGDPQPPLPHGPRAVSDVAVEQEGVDAVMTFSYPDRLLTGQPLTDLDSVEIYRLIDPAPMLISPASPAGPAARTDEAPGAGARRAALNARMTEEAFYREGKKIDVLPIAALAQHTRGASIIYRDPMTPLFANGKSPNTIAYAVISVRRGGERSPVSNRAILSPAVPPGRPTILAVTLEEGRICLEWTEPDANMFGVSPAKVGGYFVYRRLLDDDEYGDPLTKTPVAGNDFVDAAAPYGKMAYTVRATLPDKPRVEGPPAMEAGVDYRDIFPPAPPARLDALPEGKLVRLVWDPVGAADLAGYAVYRSEGSGSPERLNKDVLHESFFNDETAQPGHRYRYVVRAFDKTGNQSAPSPEATAEVF